MSKTELGAWTEVKPVTLEVIKICLEVRELIEEKIGKNLDIYIPLVYSSQIVAGKNYMVKVLFGVDKDGECAHVKIFQDLRREKPSVTAVQVPRTFDDLLIPF